MINVFINHNSNNSYVSQLLTSLILVRFDNCNSVLINLSESITECLRRAHNRVALIAILPKTWKQKQNPYE